MCDFFDDFDFDDEGESMDENSFEESLEAEMDEPFAGDSEQDDQTDEVESKNDITVKDAFIVGGAMGFAYEEGFREQKRRKRKSSDNELE